MAAGLFFVLYPSYSCIPWTLGTFQPRVSTRGRLPEPENLTPPLSFSKEREPDFGKDSYGNHTTTCHRNIR